MQSMDLQDASTVEGNLLRALHAAGMVLPSNLGQQSRLSWSRSSRTDKGVHAASAVTPVRTCAFRATCSRSSSSCCAELRGPAASQRR